ncbi:MAG: hypothetical protein JXA53_11435 [Bacteroidales bacterium]|nr:hypothetical protein [Bacteroidales bacterium]
MQTANLHNNQIFIFTRWSRKSYALFTVIGKVVHIGHLIVGMIKEVEKQLLNLFSFSFDSTKKDENDFDIEQSEQQQLLSTLLPIVNADIYLAVGFTLNIYTFSGCLLW